jgi:hypothetical protein
MMTMTALTSALAFARHGHAVFPVNWPIVHQGRMRCSCGSDSRGRPCTSPAKHPYGKLAPNGLRSASAESWQIKLWWQHVPQANLGVTTDRLVVIDVDPRHAGDESFAALEREHGQMPLTWRALTGGGGEHVIFACPDGVEIANVAAEQMENPPLGKGIDIRGRGGYIVAPPSLHISGRAYAWSVDHHPADVPLAPAPDWLITRLTARTTNGGKGHDPAQWAARKAGTVSQYRDMAIAEIAGKLLRAISLDPRFVATLVHDWNVCHCDPPLPEQQVQDIFNRICRKERERLEADHA